MNIARSSLKIFSAEILGVVLSFLGITYFARELGSETIGLFFLFQALLFFFSKPADLGTRFATEKRISEGENPGSYLSTSILMKITLLCLVVVALYAFRGYINAYLDADLVGLLALGVVLQEMSGLMKNTVSGELRVGKTAYIDLSTYLVTYGGGAVLVYLGFGVDGLIATLLAGLFVQFLLAFFERETKFGAPGLEEMYSIIDYAKYTIIPSVGTQVYQWTDILILGLLLNHAAVGSYEIAWRVAGPVLLLSQSISTTVFPQISAWDSAGSDEAIENLFSRVVTPSLIIVFPAFFGTLVLSQEILGLVFGSEYQVASLALIVIMAGKVPSSLRNITGRLLYGRDKPRLVTVASVIEIVVNVALNFFLILQFGIVGAALGTSISVTIGVIARGYFVSRFMNLRIPYDELSWCLIASGAMAVLLYSAKAVVEIETVFHLAAFVLTGAVLYGFFVLLYSPLRSLITTQIQRNLS